MKNTKQTEQQQCEPMDLLDVLLDEENSDPIILQDDTGKKLSFDQVAVIPYDAEGQDCLLYVILKPLDKIAGVADDEAVVFRADINEYGDTVLMIEDDESRAIEIFDKYYDLIEECKAERAKNNKK